jgi:hypothetical protein
LVAHLEVGDRRSTAFVEDLSAGGARLQLSNPPRPGTEGSLRWHNFEARIHVLWAKANFCGVEFK